MQLVVIHKSEEVNSNTKESPLRTQSTSSAENLLALMLNMPLKSLVFGNSKQKAGRGASHQVILLPHDWSDRIEKCEPDTAFYKDNIPVDVDTKTNTNHEWHIISNGGFAVKTDSRKLNELITDLNADVVAVNVEPQIRAGCERPIIGPGNNLLGFRRFYDNQTWPAAVPVTWPHRVYIRKKVLPSLVTDGTLPLNFKELVDRCHKSSLNIRSLDVAGVVFDLQSESGLLAFIQSNLQNTDGGGNNVQVPDSARIIGPVLFGNNITIEKDVLVVGPTVICSNAVLREKSAVMSSIIGSDVEVPQGCYVKNKAILKTPENKKKQKVINGPSIPAVQFYKRNTFRTWPRFSYAGYFKRIADIIAAAIVLILFAPVFPVIAMAIKLTSKGPVFYRDPRQGLWGRPIKCIKFRTMLVGADEMQEKLRSLNQADGPQFKIEDDPRISLVGNFLRDTYIDEIPQFFNVLLGQMSVVGPRPSPESENTLCPSWRDARLSVRPGITGLWQICRTRQPMKDFQEWIFFDIKYVRQLSVNMDLWICWQTMKKMAKNFIEKF